MVSFFNNERHISLQIMTFVLCCYRQSFSYHNNHRIYYPPTARTAKTPPGGSTTIRSIPDLCLQENRFRFNDGRVPKGHTKSQDHISSALCASGTTSTSSWDDILAPSSAPRRNHKYVTLIDKAFIIAFGGSAIFTFLVLALKSPPGSWRYFLSGGLCAAFSHVIPTPDVLIM